MSDESSFEAKERGRAVAHAVNTGRIPLDRAPYWMQQLKADPAKKAILASLAPGLIPGSRGLPQNVNPIRSALHTGTPPAAPPQERVTREIELGGGLVKMQAQLIGGKPHSEWTYEEGRDAMLWAMGPRFRQGLKPPPEPRWFIPGDSVQHTIDQGF